MDSGNINLAQSSNMVSLKELVHKIKEWVQFLLKKWLVILIFGIIGGALGLTLALLKKPLYTASTTFVLEEGGSGGGIGQYAGLASMVGIDLGGGGGGIFQGDNILELYKSRTMIQKTLLTEAIFNGKKQLLINRYLSFNKEMQDSPALKNGEFGSDNSGPVNNFSRSQDSLIGVIVKDISTNYLKVSKPDKKLSIIKADVAASDEFFAMEFNDKIVMNVNEFYIQTKTKKSLENIAILQQKTDSVRAVMNNAIYSASSITDATPNLNPTRQTQRVAPVQRSQFNAESNKAVLVELLKNLEMSKIAYRKETPLIQVIDKPVLPLTKEGLGRAKGLIFGGAIAGFLTIIFLTARRLLKQLLSS